ncbi:MAG: DNA polymerase III subunit gamma/tau, partial [Alphaproteobacteria bacterium]|nr:DNA polymerase III subunit gamma/tau [Alphaproteobacteria bacterium]
MSQTQDRKTNNSQNNTAYQVLARKYRPRNFDDLIGQEAMIRTLRNAFETGRVAHAFMLTGVRGVGKTTTARILARALNYTPEASIDLGEMGEHCQAIMDGNHVDIIEMDAASRTSIDDIREIIENVRYRPVSARYKVYIIDEVHMISKAAFNGLLKTLEEPPEHVKFIFATTEIRKVPVTVLSRCQRFDLRRLSQEETIKLLSKTCKLESANLSAENLALIARAAEGSARDALSLLDRALAHSGDMSSETSGERSGEASAAADNEANKKADLSTDDMRRMLGLADRGRVFDLFDHLMQGHIAEALEEFASQYRMGADPAIVLADLLDLTYWLTRLKYVPSAADDITVAEAQRKHGREVAQTLSIRILSRAWQTLLKGHAETLAAHNPVAAAEMALIRLAHLADMPSPEALLKQWEGQIESQAAPQTTPQTASQTESQVAPAGAHKETAKQPKQTITNFTELVALIGEMRDIRLKHALENGVHLVHFEPSMAEKGGLVEFRLAEGQEDITRLLAKRLHDWTGQDWTIRLSKEQGAETLKQTALNTAQQRRGQAAQDPFVQEALTVFPGAEITNVADL